MINIFEIEILRVKELLTKFNDSGGVLTFDTFRIEKNYLGTLTKDEYLKHLTVARQTLEKAHYKANFHLNKIATKNNRDTIPSPETDHKELSNSGKEINAEEFLGPFYDLENKKPIIRGMLNETMNCYFYYDDIEKTENALETNLRIDEFEERFQHENGSGMGLIYALMEPPYSIRIANNIKEKGEFVVELLGEIFDDLNQLKIYKWSTNCSAIFDPGKEWWGCFFWTVYNPNKNIYIGIIGSGTD